MLEGLADGPGHRQHRPGPVILHDVHVEIRADLLKVQSERRHFVAIEDHLGLDVGAVQLGVLLHGEDGRFSMEGGSWTSNISWVRGYDRVLAPMDEASSLFHERVLAEDVRTDDPRYRNALFHLLTAETSCYRYWGEGIWTDYGAELARRTIDIVTHDL